LQKKKTQLKIFSQKKGQGIKLMTHELNLYMFEKNKEKMNYRYAFINKIIKKMLHITSAARNYRTL